MRKLSRTDSQLDSLNVDFRPQRLHSDVPELPKKGSLDLRADLLTCMEPDAAVREAPEWIAHVLSPEVCFAVAAAMEPTPRGRPRRPPCVVTLHKARVWGEAGRVLCHDGHASVGLDGAGRRHRRKVGVDYHLGAGDDILEDLHSAGAHHDVLQPDALASSHSIACKEELDLHGLPLEGAQVHPVALEARPRGVPARPAAEIPAGVCGYIYVLGEPSPQSSLTRRPGPIARVWLQHCNAAVLAVHANLQAIPALCRTSWDHLPSTVQGLKVKPQVEGELCPRPNREE
mmetsp:Transcript_16523/g.47158  ORF Transcript_16523/g.47158 Transcript_16523/m.47158 type:complete len:287 (-) Transcript_16523:128-988(-)